MKRFVSIICWLLLFSCERSSIEADSKENQISIKDAKRWFTDTLTTFNSSSDQKTPIWDRAYHFNFDQKKAIVVPLNYGTDMYPFLSTDNSELDPKQALISRNELNVLLIYRDSTGTMTEEVLTVVPDQSYVKTAARQVKNTLFDGMLLIHRWNGDFKYGFLYKNGEIDRQVAFSTLSNSTSRTMDFIPSCVFIDWFSCPGGYNAPSPMCTFMYTEEKCTLVWNPNNYPGSFGGYGEWLSTGGGTGGIGGTPGGGGGVAAITNTNTLSPGDKEMLVNRYQEFLLRGCLNEKIDETFTSNGLKFNFNYNPQLSGPAVYSPAGYNQTIYFRDSPSIEQDALSEELFHGFQNWSYSAGIGQYHDVGRSNLEFEAKLYKDLVSTFKGGAYVGVPMGHPEHDDYTEWLHSMTDYGTKYPTAISATTFLHFLQVFKSSYIEYNTPSNTSLVGQALINLINISNCPK